MQANAPIEYVQMWEQVLKIAPFDTAFGLLRTLLSQNQRQISILRGVESPPKQCYNC
jgi:hypothetical protein